MARTLFDLAKDNQSPLERAIVHSVRALLRAMNVFHAAWVIEASHINPTTVRINAYWNPSVAVPNNMQLPTDAITFVQNTDAPITEFENVNLNAIANALAKRIYRETQPARGRK